MKCAYLRKFLIIAFITGISGCQSLGIGLSLDERYQKAYQKVLADPNDDNIKTFMKLSREKGERDMQRQIRKPQPTLVKAIRGLLSILNHMATMDLSGPDNKKEVICHYSNRMKIWSS